MLYLFVHETATNETMMMIDHAKGVNTCTMVWKMTPTIETRPPMCTAPR